MPEKPAQSARHPRSKRSNRRRDRSLDKFAGERFTDRVAQAHHAMTAIIGHPHIDETLRDAESSRSLGAAPSVDENPLYDQCASGRCNSARPVGSGVHARLTQGGNA